MKFSLSSLILGLAAITTTSAMPRDSSGVIAARQRPVPNGQCCVANTNLKQDPCNGGAGRCVPGGNNCGGSLSCVAFSGLTCDNNVIERGNTLCRANAPGGGFFDGASIIQSLSQAKVN